MLLFLLFGQKTLLESSIRRTVVHWQAVHCIASARRVRSTSRLSGKNWPASSQWPHAVSARRRLNRLTMAQPERLGRLMGGDRSSSSLLSDEVSEYFRLEAGPRIFPGVGFRRLDGVATAAVAAGVATVVDATAKAAAS